MKKTLLTIAMAGLFACSNPTAPASIPQVPADTVYVKPDTVYVNEDYSFSLDFRLNFINNNTWQVTAKGRIYNDGVEEIVELKPHLRLYKTVRDLEADKWTTSNYGNLGDRLEFTKDGYILHGITDTIPVDGWKIHLTKSDTLPNDVGYWRYRFFKEDSSLLKGNNSIEGKIR